MAAGDPDPPSEHESVWAAAGDGPRLPGAPEAGDQEGVRRPGPIRVPARLRGRSALVGWAVSLAVILLALVVYVFTRPPAPSSLHAAPPPTWGSLSLKQVALTEARAAGDPHPTAANWLFSHRDRVLQVLTGSPGASAQAEFVVFLTGSFRGNALRARLPGSQPAGHRLILLVSAFDGRVTGTLVTDQPLPGLTSLGIVHPLRLSLL